MRFAVILETLERATAAIPALVAVAIALALGKWTIDSTHGFDENAEIEDEHNGAFAVAYTAYFVGLALAMAGTLFGGGQLSVWWGALKVLGECLAIVVLMWVSLWVNDRLILTKFSVNREIGEDRNFGAAFCVAGVLIATGFSMNGALTGFSGETLEFWPALRDILIYWAFGQSILVLGARLYSWTAPFDVHRLIELDNNRAVGLSFGGYLVGLGIVARTSLVAAGREPAGNEILRTLTIAAVGISGLLAARIFVNLIFLKRSSLNAEISLNDNVAAGALALGGYLAAAILLAATLHR